MIFRGISNQQYLPTLHYLELLKWSQPIHCLKWRWASPAFSKTYCRANPLKDIYKIQFHNGKSELISTSVEVDYRHIALSFHGSFFNLHRSSYISRQWNDQRLLLSESSYESDYVNMLNMKIYNLLSSFRRRLSFVGQGCVFSSTQPFVRQ